jgi:hydroxyacylglutathione hydrolase
MAHVVTIETPELGDRSYVAHDGRVAVAVDPQRDVDRVLEVLEAEKVRLACVVETHLHNDYVSGGRELALRAGALHVVGGAEEVAFPCEPAREGEDIPVGQLSLRPVATPGHTVRHTSFVLSERGRPVAVFTGGSLLYGTVGRTDLVAPELTDELTRSQFRSVRRLVSQLEDDVAVHPTHGFGSFCSSAAPSGARASTVGAERRANVAFVIDDEDLFVKTLLSGLGAYPRYYAHMGPINRKGPAPLDLSPPEPVDARELRRRLDDGEWVVDLRGRRAFAAGHLPGSVGAEHGLLFTTYLGWVMPFGAPVTLIGDTPARVAAAQRDLARIGVDRPAGAAVGRPEDLAVGALDAYRVTDFAGLAETRRRRPGLVVLDVRLEEEWRAGHLVGALHVPLHELEERIEEVPPGEVFVHCGVGYRSSLAASLLARAGRRPVLVDEAFDRARRAGLAVVTD